VERKLMDYQSHKFRIINHLANNYVMALTSRELFVMYEKMMEKI
jgi:hypothetical protein